MSITRGAVLSCLLVGLVTTLTLGAAAPADAYMRWAQIDAIASWLAMREVQIECQTQEESDEDLHIASGALAYVPGYLDANGRWHPWSYSVFSAGICESIMALNAHDTDISDGDIALGFLVLTHESGHLRGWKWAGDESRTECWAIRHVGYVFAQWGVTDPARRYELVSWAVWHHTWDLGPEYHRGHCKLPPHDPVPFSSGRGAPALPPRPVHTIAI